MNALKDYKGRLVIFGDNFLIREEISEGLKDLVLYASDTKHLIYRASNTKEDLSTLFPLNMINDFSKVWRINNE